MQSLVLSGGVFLTVVVVLVAGLVVGLLKSQSALTLSSVLSVVPFPIAVGVMGLGMVIALALDPTIVAAAIVTVLVAATASIVAILTKLGDNKKAAREDAAALTIELAKISRSVDGVATKQVDKVASLEETITQLRAQLAKEESRATTLAASQAAAAVVAAGTPAVVPKVEP